MRWLSIAFQSSAHDRWSDFAVTVPPGCRLAETTPASRDLPAETDWLPLGSVDTLMPI